MGLRIHTNVQAISAQRNLEANGRTLQSTEEKLSSGSRIVRAGDDAAGLAISERTRGHIRSMRQDIRNAADGISLVQTAEGAMSEIGNILIRFRELSTQAASDTIGDSERGYLDKEFQQLHHEIERIAESTEFNGLNLLGSGADVREIQVGIHANPDNDVVYYDVLKSNLSPGKLGINGMNVASKSAALSNLSGIDRAISVVARTRSEVGAIQNRLQAAIRSLENSDENLTAANSRIRDADMALETSEVTKEKILQEVGTSVMAQANQSPLIALKLLG